MFLLLILGMRFLLGHIQARVWSSSIVIWVTRVFADVAFTFRSLPCFNVNYRREVNSLRSSGREFQILGPNVLRLFSTNVVDFALLTTKSFFLLAECEPFLKYMCMKSGFKEFKVIKTLIANLRKRLTSMVGRSAFNSKLLLPE